MKKFLVSCLTFALIAGCASKTQKVIEPTEGTPEGNTFERGLKALEQENYSEASRIFEGLLVSKPGSEFDLVALYNAGAAREGLQDCPKAAERYREVVRSSGGKFQRIEAQALFRLSLMYECLGQDTKALTSLLDARRRGKSLPFETLNAEIPAKLAAAYARVGNRTKALEYFNLASKGLKTLVAREGSSSQKETLSRTLYLMGQLTPAQRAGTAKADSFFQALGMQQPYLLQAAELGHAVYAKKAYEDLTLGYDMLWKMEFAESDRQRDFYIRGLQAVKELRKIRLPTASPEASAIFAHLDKTELRLQTELAKFAETNKLTSEGEKREALKREGRLVSPTPAKPKPVKKR